MAGEGFLERSLHSFAVVWGRALESEDLARRTGLLQGWDPRVKVIGLPALIIASVTSHRLSVIAAMFGLALFLAVPSHIPIKTMALRAWLGVLAFTGVIAIPAIFITPGRAIFRLPLLQWAASAQGIRSAVFLIARAEAAATLSLLMVLCTPWAGILKAMRILRIPVVLVVVFGMTYRYILCTLETAAAMFEARRSRVLGSWSGQMRRHVAVSTAGVLFDKTLKTGDDVYLAMQSRGFTGEAHVLDEPRLRNADWVALAMLLGLAVSAYWLGR
jgi:cobalt/nickel transport system permease protein